MNIYAVIDQTNTIRGTFGLPEDVPDHVAQEQGTRMCARESAVYGPMRLVLVLDDSAPIGRQVTVDDDGCAELS